MLILSHRPDIVSDQNGVPVRSVHHYPDLVSDQAGVIDITNASPL